MEPEKKRRTKKARASKKPKRHTQKTQDTEKTGHNTQHTTHNHHPSLSHRIDHDNMQRHSSKKKLVIYSFPPFMVKVVAILLIVVVVAPFWWFHSSPSTSTSGSHPQGLTKRLGGAKHNSRIAIIIPYVGEGVEGIPSYLELFCNAAAGSASLVDFLLIHNGVLTGYRGEECPPNVRFISLESMEKFSRLLLRVIDREDDKSLAVESKEKLVGVLAKYIIKYPYVLVEFKPALGHIFNEYLQVSW
jgi:hypothetical protein